MLVSYEDDELGWTYSERYSGIEKSSWVSVGFELVMSVVDNGF